MQIAENTVVSIDYTLTVEDGQVVDSSEGRGPLTYLHGASNIIPGLENALEGHESGEQMQVALGADDAYGQPDPSLVQPVPRERFEGIEKIEPGMQFEAQTPGGPRPIVVTDVNDEQITIDANHPLAGKDLQFDVTVVDVREATEDEVAQGRAL